MAVLCMKNVGICSHAGDVIVDGLTLTLEAGKTTALIGESGSGKTMTALACMGLLPPALQLSEGSSIQLNGEEISAATPAQWRKLRGKAVAMVFQEPMSALNPLHGIGQQIAEMFRHEPEYSIASQRDARVRALLQEVGLEMLQERLQAYPHELSGGQRQRVMIAMAIANRPKLLIADEPTTALDAQLQQDIMELLAQLQNKHGMSMLLISHHLPTVHAVADNVLVMQQGKVVEQGAAAQVTTKPTHPYSQTLMQAVPERKVTPIENNDAPILTCKQVSVRFPVGKGWFGKPLHVVDAVQGVDLEIKRGEVVGLVGESGSGKSSLAQAIVGLHRYEGEMLWSKDAQSYALPLRVQYMFQDPFGSLNPRMSVLDCVAEGMLVHQLVQDKSDAREQVRDLLAEVELPRDMDARYPHELSGGQRQRVALARALAVKPQLLVLDEPTSALDATTQRQVLELLTQLQQDRGLSCLMITHDLRVVHSLAHRTYVMHGGALVEHGDTEALFANPRHNYTKLLVANL